MMTNQMIAEATAGIRSRLADHELYASLTSHRSIAVFMEHHVWAVWDFMSLLKALQRHLTCVDMPWTPKGDPEIRYLINDIVIGEESDVDRHGRRTSHFEMYLAAMRGLGASTAAIEQFVELVGNGIDISRALDAVGAPAASARFVRRTFEVIQRGRVHEIAAVFTLGREDVIPTMFLGILDRLEGGGEVDTADLRYYLERHVEVDGDHHGPLARRMVERLCGSDPLCWQEATEAAQVALSERLVLWNAVAAQIARPVPSVSLAATASFSLTA